MSFLHEEDYFEMQKYKQFIEIKEKIDKNKNYDDILD